MEDKEKKDKVNDSLCERTKTYVEVVRKTRDPYKAVKSYCEGNKWLTENARAVGNWKD